MHIIKNKSSCRRATLHKEVLVLNGPFSPILHKKSPKCDSIPEILLFALKKSSHFKTAQHLKTAGICVR